MPSDQLGAALATMVSNVRNECLDAMEDSRGRSLALDSLSHDLQSQWISQMSIPKQAEHLAGRAPADRLACLRALPFLSRAPVLGMLEPLAAAECVALMDSTEEAMAMLDAMSGEKASACLVAMRPEKRARHLAVLTAERQAGLIALMSTSDPERGMSLKAIDIKLAGVDTAAVMVARPPKSRADGTRDAIGDALSPEEKEAKLTSLPEAFQQELRQKEKKWQDAAGVVQASFPAKIARGEPSRLLGERAEKSNFARERAQEALQRGGWESGESRIGWQKKQDEEEEEIRSAAGTMHAAIRASRSKSLAQDACEAAQGESIGAILAGVKASSSRRDALRARVRELDEHASIHIRILQAWVRGFTVRRALLGQLESQREEAIEGLF